MTNTKRIQSPRLREPATRLVPLDLCRDTVMLLARLPMGEIYLLARRWEGVCPEFFTGELDRTGDDSSPSDTKGT